MLFFLNRLRAAKFWIIMTFTGKWLFNLLQNWTRQLKSKSWLGSGQGRTTSLLLLYLNFKKDAAYLMCSAISDIAKPTTLIAIISWRSTAAIHSTHFRYSYNQKIYMTIKIIIDHQTYHMWNFKCEISLVKNMSHRKHMGFGIHMCFWNFTRKSHVNHMWNTWQFM